MEPAASGAPAVIARRVVPKKTADQRGGENFLVILAFIGGVLLFRFLGALAALIFAVLVGVVLFLWYLTNWAKRREKSILPPSAKTR